MTRRQWQIGRDCTLAERHTPANCADDKKDLSRLPRSLRSTLSAEGCRAHVLVSHMHRANIYPSKQPPLHAPREILICQSSHELDHLQPPHQPLIHRLGVKQLARRQPACVERLSVSICSLVLELQPIAVLQVSDLNRSVARYRATA